MKKVYKKPSVEIELYTLDSSIAANCEPVVNVGPGTETITMCSEWKGAFDTEDFSLFSLYSTGTSPFYEDDSAGCDCYYTGGGSTYFTS